MRVAAITMCHNEGWMLQLWTRHYGRLLGLENLFVIDHGSTDGSAQTCGGNVIRLPREKFDDNQRAATISLQQQSLLTCYDAVIYTDTDEFLIHDPQDHASFPAFLATVDAPVSAGIGIELAHLPSIEPELDTTRSILEQRSYGVFKASGSKPILVTEPTEWAGGFHMVRSEPKFRPDLFLIHLKNVDLTRGLRRLELTRSMAWAERSLQIGIGAHQRIEDAQYKEWFYDNRQASHDKGEFDEFMPEAWAETMRKSFQDYKGFLRFEQDLQTGREIKSGLFHIPDRFRGAL